MASILFQRSIVNVPRVAVWEISLEKVRAFQAVSLSFLGYPLFAKNVLWNALLVVRACPPLIRPPYRTCVVLRSMSPGVCIVG